MAHLLRGQEKNHQGHALARTQSPGTHTQLAGSRTPQPPQKTTGHQIPYVQLSAHGHSTGSRETRVSLHTPTCEHRAAALPRVTGFTRQGAGHVHSAGWTLAAPPCSSPPSRGALPSLFTHWLTIQSPSASERSRSLSQVTGSELPTVAP